MVQVGILFRHAHHIVPQQFAHRTEEILHEEEETEQTPKRRLIKIGRHTTIANHTDGGDDKGSKPDKTYHKEEDRQQRRYLIDEDELQKMVGTHGGEIKETRDDDTLCHEYCERKGLGKREPLLDIERQRKKARRKVYATHRKRQRVARTSQPQKLHRDDGNNENGVDQIHDDAMPPDGVRGARLQKFRYRFGEIMSDHCFRFYFL